MLRSGLLDEVWTPDERTRALRRLTNRRERLVHARTRAKNEAHGVLARSLCERPPVTSRAADEAARKDRCLSPRSRHHPASPARRHDVNREEWSGDPK